MQKSTSPDPSTTTDPPAFYYNGVPVFVALEVPARVGGVFVPAGQFGDHRAFIVVAGDLDATEQARAAAQLVEGTVYALAG